MAAGSLIRAPWWSFLSWEKFGRINPKRYQSCYLHRSVTGARLGRPDDTVGLASAVNRISHQGKLYGRRAGALVVEFELDALAAGDVLDRHWLSAPVWSRVRPEKSTTERPSGSLGGITGMHESGRPRGSTSCSRPCLQSRSYAARRPPNRRSLRCARRAWSWHSRSPRQCQVSSSSGGRFPAPFWRAGARRRLILARSSVGHLPKAVRFGASNAVL
jgi:hypothetical protein